MAASTLPITAASLPASASASSTPASAGLSVGAAGANDNNPKIVVGNQTYSVQIILKDANDQIIDLPASFDPDTMKKAMDYAKGVLMAHKAALGDGATVDVRTIKDNCVVLSDGREIHHSDVNLAVLIAGNQNPILRGCVTPLTLLINHEDRTTITVDNLTVLKLSDKVQEHVIKAYYRHTEWTPPARKVGEVGGTLTLPSDVLTKEKNWAFSLPIHERTAMYNKFRNAALNENTTDTQLATFEINGIRLTEDEIRLFKLFQSVYRDYQTTNPGGCRPFSVELEASCDSFLMMEEHIRGGDAAVNQWLERTTTDVQLRQDKKAKFIEFLNLVYPQYRAGDGRYPTRDAFWGAFRNAGTIAESLRLLIDKSTALAGTATTDREIAQLLSDHAQVLAIVKDVVYADEVTLQIEALKEANRVLRAKLLYIQLGKAAYIQRLEKWDAYLALFTAAGATHRLDGNTAGQIWSEAQLLEIEIGTDTRPPVLDRIGGKFAQLFPQIAAAI